MSTGRRTRRGWTAYLLLHTMSFTLNRATWDHRASFTVMTGTASCIYLEISVPRTTNSALLAKTGIHASAQTVLTAVAVHWLRPI
jgi:hypothetical protein